MDAWKAIQLYPGKGYSINQGRKLAIYLYFNGKSNYFWYSSATVQAFIEWPTEAMEGSDGRTLKRTCILIDENNGIS